MSSINLYLRRTDSRRGSVRLAAGLGLAGAALVLGACAQPPGSSMGGPAEGMSPDSAAPQRAMRQRPATLPGEVNRSDSNFEQPDQSIKSGPPSVVKPAQ